MRGSTWRCGLLAGLMLAAVSASAAIEPVVIENTSEVPFTYRLYAGPDQPDPWTRPQTIPGGQWRAIGTVVPLVIGYQDGEEWKSFTLPTGRTVTFAPGEQGRPALFMGQGKPREAQVDREIKILATADIEYRNRFPQWEERVRGLIAAASRYYELEFGIRFTLIGCRPWEFNTRYQQTLHEQLASLQKMELGQADLTVAFARSVVREQKGTIIGWGLRLSEYVVVTDSWPELAYAIALPKGGPVWKLPDFGSTATLIHELGHVLGAFHVDDANSVMAADMLRMMPPRVQFDDTNREVIRSLRHLDFRRGPDSIPLQTGLRVRALYFKHRLPTEPAELDPISSGYYFRAILAKTSGNQPLATRMIDRSVTWWRGKAALPPPADGRAISTRLPSRQEFGKAPLGPAPTPPPTFAATSDEAVDLRYRFKPGERFSFQVERWSWQEFGPREGSLLDRRSIALEARVIAKGPTGDGTERLSLTVTRASARRSDEAGEPAFDSQRARQTTDPHFLPLAMLVDRAMAIEVSPRGRVTSEDFPTFLDHVHRRFADGAIARVALDLLVSATFVRLPVQPLGKDATYDLNDSPIGDVGLKLRMAGRRRALSSDRKLALLELESRPNVQTFREANFTIDRAESRGWLVFDREKGASLSSFVRTTWNGALAPEKGSVKVRQVCDVTYKRLGSEGERP